MILCIRDLIKIPRSENMYSYNILVVDDEKEITDAIEVYLKNQNYNVFKAYDGIEALDIFNKEKIHLVLMDIMMPRLDGTGATIKIRQTSTVPIIMLSAKSEDMDKIWGLNIGADDYITKPFNPMELLARVNSNLRRYTSYSAETIIQQNIIRIGGIELNDDTKEIVVDGELIKITPLEYRILYLLMSNPGKVFSIEEIYEKVWNEPAYNPDTVTVHIRRIREKIEINPKEPKYLKVVWGIGYKFDKQERT
ncbi:MAG: vanR2 [Clostridia bacterium]|nr:vanR2 [Clostridia bacterium]